MPALLANDLPQIHYWYVRNFQHLFLTDPKHKSVINDIICRDNLSYREKQLHLDIYTYGLHIPIYLNAIAIGYKVFPTTFNIDFTVACCHPKDHFCRKTAHSLLIDRFDRNEIMSISYTDAGYPNYEKCLSYIRKSYISEDWLNAFPTISHRAFLDIDHVFHNRGV